MIIYYEYEIVYIYNIHAYILYIYIYIYIYIYLFLYVNFVCQVLMSKYINKKLRHLFTKKLNLQRLNKITKSVKSINLKTN